MTYSIVAFDAATEQFGVAVETHQPSVGAWVPWLKPGVGAVATQSWTNVGFGPLGLKLLGGGLSAEHTLAALLASDPERARRQVAVIDRAGNVAVHTGERCIAHAGHQTGVGYSVQANMMLHPTVPAAMAGAFEDAQGSLAERLMRALHAAEGEGGDIRGAQSAALLVVSSEAEPDWENIVCNLRVDDHTNPIMELRRLVDQHIANALSDQGYAQAKRGEIDAAIQTWAQARARAGDATEMQFWQAVTLADEYGRFGEGRALLHDLAMREPQWIELVRRLVPAGLLTHPETVAQLLGEGEAA